MNTSEISLSALICAVVSYLFTWRCVAYCARTARMEDRTSDRQVPRGGGIAIVATLLSALILLVAFGVLPARWTLALIISLAGVSAIGWVDDRASINPFARLAVHVAAAALVVANTPLPQALEAAPGARFLLTILLAWCINLYNFMDGIDGIAATQAVLLGVVGAALLYVLGLYGLAALSACIAGASLGFLVWNRPPAMIFMGDVGSGSLGLMVGAITLAAYSLDRVAAPPLLILLGVFLVDATVTLLVRIGRGAKVWLPHRTHAYQKLATQLNSHRSALLAFVAAHIALLIPLAVMSVTYPERGWTFAVSALLALTVIAAALRPGL